MTKTLVSFIFILLLTSFGLAQPKKANEIENNVYYRALLASLEKMEKEWGTMNYTGVEKRVRIDYRNIIMEVGPWMTDALPSQLGPYRVKYLKSQELIDEYKKLRKEFPVLMVYPMTNEGNRLNIHFNLYWVSNRRRGLSYSLSDWSKVYFRYDCEKREYMIDEVKLGGV